MEHRAESRPGPASDTGARTPVGGAHGVPSAEGVTRLVEDVIAGDREARGRFYDRFAPRLYRRLRGRYGGPRGLDADDLLQDAFLSFFQHDARVLAAFLDRVPADERSESRLEACLWDVACGVASNRRRSRRRSREVPRAELDAVSSLPDPERVGVAQDTLRRLVACLRSAGGRVHLYYKLRFADGLSPREVSDVTGWSTKATYKLKDTLNLAVRRCARRLHLR